jgi:hypothetical protein
MANRDSHEQVAGAVRVDGVDDNVHDADIATQPRREARRAIFETSGRLARRPAGSFLSRLPDELDVQRERFH